MAARTENSPERLDAGEQSGRLIASEHRGRYLWAAQLAAGSKVLDAGCGTGYGLAIMERAGAGQLVGVDISQEAVAAARELNRGAAIEVVVGDVRALPFADGEFDLVVCFEVIEHVDDRETVIDELARVVGADGVLCISTPNRRVYPPGNPHHVYEYEPEEFEQALSKRFAHVTLHRQTAWLASAILADPEFAAEGSEETIAPRTVKTEPREAGRETFTIALASQAEMPSPQSLVMLGDTFEVSWWESQVRGAGSEAREAAAQAIGEREAARRELASLQQALKSAQRSSLTSAQKLLAAEEKLAQATARVFALEAAHADLIERQRELQARIVRADEVLEAVKSSWSWRLTAPLRRLRPGRR